MGGATIAKTFERVNMANGGFFAPFAHQNQWHALINPSIAGSCGCFIPWFIWSKKSLNHPTKNPVGVVGSGRVPIYQGCWQQAIEIEHAWTDHMCSSVYLAKEHISSIKQQHTCLKSYSRASSNVYIIIHNLSIGLYILKKTKPCHQLGAFKPPETH